MTNVETLTSTRNPLLKDIRRASLRGSLTESGSAIAETFHLLEEALKSDCPIEAVIAADSVWKTVEEYLAASRNVRVIIVPDNLFVELSATETSQGVMTLVNMPSWTIDQMLGGQPLLVVLDGLQDPGNAGTIVRTAEAFGASGVVFLKGTVSPFNPKTLRASAGSLFRLPFVASASTESTLAALKQRKLDLYAAMPKAANRADQVDFTRRTAIVIGSEGRGVSRLVEHASNPLAIPTLGVESLNASVAAGVLLYEARRQRGISNEPV